MGNLRICRVCSGADPKRVKDGMIRCVQKHKFVDPEGTCREHSFKSSNTMTTEEKEALLKAFFDILNDKKGKTK